MSAKKLNLTVKTGSTISWAGKLTEEGITDFTGYTLKAQFRRAPVGQAAGALLGNAVISWLSELTGTFHLEVPHTVTRTWPNNGVVFMDLLVIAPDGTRLRTETIRFETAQSVTEEP